MPRSRACSTPCSIRAAPAPASCASSGTGSDLVYVSPKSGRAVSRQAGEPWKHRLLALPAFLREALDPSPRDIADGFVLTGFFLARHVLEPRGLSFADARASFIAALAHDARRPSNEANGPGPLAVRPAAR